MLCMVCQKGELVLINFAVRNYYYSGPKKVLRCLCCLADIIPSSQPLVKEISPVEPVKSVVNVSDRQLKQLSLFDTLEFIGFR